MAILKFNIRHRPPHLSPHNLYTHTPTAAAVAAAAAVSIPTPLLPLAYNACQHLLAIATAAAAATAGAVTVYTDAATVKQPTPSADRPMPPAGHQTTQRKGTTTLEYLSRTLRAHPSSTSRPFTYILAAILDHKLSG